VEREGEQDLTRRLENLTVEQYTSPSGGSSSNNPFLNRQSTAPTPGYNPFVAAQPADPVSSQNPFLNPANSRPASYAQRSSRHTNTPVASHSAYSPYASTHQASYGSSAGYMAPPQANPGYAMQSTDRHSRRRSQTPAINSSQHQQYTAILRPQSAQSQRSSQSLDNSSVLLARPSSSSSMRGLKVMKQKDYRGFFKLGRV
jgi:hypothetical protein